MKLLKKGVLLIIVMLSLVGLVGCENDDRIKIGILQLVTHEALNAAKDSFIAELAEAGYIDGDNIVITVQNPETDPATMSLMAKKLVRDNDLVLGIATDAALALKVAAQAKKNDIPILFTAVTDPTDGLVTTLESPGGNVTGTSDMNPIKEQIELAMQVCPEMTTLGILYTAEEINSQVQANLAKAEAEKLGLTVKVQTAPKTENLELIVNNFSKNKNIDLLYIPTDNTIASKMSIIKTVASNLKLPVICGEENMTKEGGLITVGINYTTLGAMTGKMAVEILEGKNPKDMPVQTLSLDECVLVLNVEMMNLIEITIPENLYNAAKKVNEPAE